MMKFKNLRRPRKSEAKEQAEDEPPQKKRSLSNKRLYFPPNIEEEEDIENTKAALKEAWSQNKAKNKKLIMQLYKATSKDRFQWIQECGPTAREVIAEYPMIRKSRLVSYFYHVKTKVITHTLNVCMFSYGLISSKSHLTKEHWITLVKSGRNF